MTKSKACDYCRLTIRLPIKKNAVTFYTHNENPFKKIVALHLCTKCAAKLFPHLFDKNKAFMLSLT